MAIPFQVENRNEKAEKLNTFAIGQFHNHFNLQSEQESTQKYLNAIERVKDIQNVYRPHRKYKRKDAGPDDEQTRVRITLLEYGNKGGSILAHQLKQQQDAAKSTTNDEALKSTKSNDDNSDDSRNESVCIPMVFVFAIRVTNRFRINISVSLISCLD